MLSHIQSWRLSVLFISLIIIFSKIQTKVIDKNNCPPNAQSTQPLPQKRHQRLFLFSDAILRIKPNIIIPYELADNINTGFHISLPITVRFQSQFQLMSEWIKQLVANKVKVLSKNINTFSASITELLGLIHSDANVVPKPTKSRTGLKDNFNTSGTGVDADGAHNDGDLGPIDDAVNHTVPHIYDNNDSNHHCIEHYISRQLEHNTRAHSRAALYKSIEITHSKFGKSCLMRAICEVSQIPLMAPNSGLFGQILDMFLTVNPLHKEFDEDFDDYMNAQIVGQNSFAKQSKKQLNNNSFTDECLHRYGNDCPFSLFRNFIHNFFIDNNN